MLKATRALLSAVPVALQKLGTRVFNDSEQLGVLGQDLFNRLKAASYTGKPLSKGDADRVARSVQKWAMERGAINYVHWFSPVRGENAEKHDSFIDLDYKTGNMIIDFNGNKLFQGETDGSSFPNGSLRATHMAAAYTGWDTTSPPFIKGDCLFIPSSFIAWTGDSLDEKTPLLRSHAAINQHGLRLLRLLGDTEAARVISNVGWEQEFHVIDLDDYLRRPDLLNCGRTLIGAAPIRGQQTSLNYFGSIPMRIKAFFTAAQSELWSVGVSLQTLHNEVAPGQHETAPIFSVTNVAADQNTLTMKVLSEMAYRNGLAVLFHEKPFMGLNGNGKHNNWGLNTDTGKNLFVPGNNAEAQRSFITFVAALIRGINNHGDVIRAAVSGAANDHRLGAQEAPPAIISVYPGIKLTRHLESVIAGGPLEGYGTGQPDMLKFGASAVLEVKKPLEDRNRTAPFPFCGNRWECRAVGGGQNINFPLASINTIMAESMAHVANRIESLNGNVREAVAQVLKENIRVVFNGNGYGQEWVEEAAKRGLPNLRNTPAALAAFGSKKNIELFGSMKVLSETEFLARKNIMYDAYIKQIKMEMTCLLDMIKTGVIPAIIGDFDSTSKSKIGSHYDKYVQDKKTLYANLMEATEKLEAMKSGFANRDGHDDGSEEQDKADANYCLEVLKQMLEVRKYCDRAEMVCQGKLWPYPKYNDMLYRHHYEGEEENIRNQRN